ncbi:MAG: alpha/beta fold hydrolase [Calditrichia bacterium]
MKKAVIQLPLLLGLMWVLPLVAFAKGDCGKVDVDGHRLYFCKHGDRGPVVVFDAGLKDFSKAWSNIIPKLKRHAQVVVYDRAGLGKSDNAAGPRTSKDIAEDLYKMLKRADLKGPYILVGHEFGGWNMRVFASMYPEETAGMVLVDSPHEDFDAIRKKSMTPRQRVSWEKSLRVNKSVQMPRGIRLEYSSQNASRNLVRNARKLGKKPLVVIAGTKHNFQPRQNARKLEKTWELQQKKLTRLSRNSKLLIAANSGSYVQFEQPKVVVDGVLMVMESLRTGKPLSTISFKKSDDKKR